LPKLNVGLGTTKKTFDTEFVVTNKTILVGWTFEALIGGEASLVVRGNPTVSVNPLDPITYNLDLAKELKCKPLQNSSHLRAGDDPDIIAPVSISCEYVGLPDPAYFYDAITVTSNVDSAHCLDLAGKNTKNGNHINVYPCNKGSNQQWQWDQSTNAVYLASESGHADKCWQVTAIGEPDYPDKDKWLVIHDCDGSDKQAFHYDEKKRTISPVSDPALCLDLPDFKVDCSGGCQVGLWPCSDQLNQKWTRRDYNGKHIGLDTTSVIV